MSTIGKGCLPRLFLFGKRNFEKKGQRNFVKIFHFRWLFDGRILFGSQLIKKKKLFYFKSETLSLRNNNLKIWVILLVNALVSMFPNAIVNLIFFQNFHLNEQSIFQSINLAIFQKLLRIKLGYYVQEFCMINPANDQAMILDS